MVMFRVVLGSLFVHHGLMHLAIWLPPALNGPAPATGTALFDPGVSWLLSGSSADGARWVALLLAVAAAALYGGAGVELIVAHAGWRGTTAVAALVSLLLVALYFTPWGAVGAVIDGGLLGVLLWTHGRLPQPELQPPGHR